MSDDTTQKRHRLEAEHNQADDGRRAHPVSNAPYETETHSNEEQAKRKTIDKQMKRDDDAADLAPRPAGGPQKPAKGKQDAPNYDKREDDGRAISEEDLSSANDE